MGGVLQEREVRMLGAGYTWGEGGSCLSHVHIRSHALTQCPQRPREGYAGPSTLEKATAIFSETL